MGDQRARSAGIAVPVAPRERLDFRHIAQPGPQNRAVADALSDLTRIGVEKCGHGPAGVCITKLGIAAGKSPASRIEHILAQGDVLTWDIGLSGRTTVGFADDAAVCRRPGAPVDPPALECQLSGRPGGEPGDQWDHFPGCRIDGDDPSAVRRIVRREQASPRQTVFKRDIDDRLWAKAAGGLFGCIGCFAQRAQRLGALIIDPDIRSEWVTRQAF